MSFDVSNETENRMSCIKTNIHESLVNNKKLIPMKKVFLSNNSQINHEFYYKSFFHLINN